MILKYRLFTDAPSAALAHQLPPRDVCRLHRLPHNGHQLAAQPVEARLASQLGREGLQPLDRVALSAVEAPIPKAHKVRPTRNRHRAHASLATTFPQSIRIDHDRTAILLSCLYKQ